METLPLIILAAAPFIGSFAGLLIMRLPAGEPVALGRSRCDLCHETLGASELVPLFSWLYQRGRCRHCGEKLSVFFPAMELLAVFIAIWALTINSGTDLVFSACLGWCLMVLAIIDWRHYLLPDKLTLPLAGTGILFAYLVRPEFILDHLIGAVIGYALFALIDALYLRIRGRHGMGMGDAKLLAAGGAWLTWQAIPSIIFIAALLALFTTILQHRTGMMSSVREGNDDLAQGVLSTQLAVPFGTFLCAAIWLIWTFGPIQLG